MGAALMRACFALLVQSRAEFLASLPRKRITAGALIRDDADRVLLVEPTYKDRWLIPGGTVETHESPAQGVAREVLEELGVPLQIGRALVMQWMRTDDDPDGVIHFVYDGGVVDAATITTFRLPPAELRSYRFVDPAEVPDLTTRETAARIRGASAALEDGRLSEITA